MNLFRKLFGKDAPPPPEPVPSKIPDGLSDRVESQPTLKSLAEIGDEMRTLANALGVPHNHLPSLGQGLSNDWVHLDVYSGYYHYCLWERGVCFEHRRTRDLSELLFWVANGLTFNLASTYESTHRVNGEDQRRILFRRQLELMTQLGPEFASRLERKLDDILARYPYRDDPARPLPKDQTGSG